MGYEEQYKAAEKAGEVKDLTPEFVEFKTKGDHILGRLVNVVEVQSTLSEGTYKQYLFETDTGLVKISLGAATDKEIEGSIVINGLYRIEFLGQEKIAKGRKVNKFSITAFGPTAEREPDKADEVPF